MDGGFLVSGKLGAEGKATAKIQIQAWQLVSPKQTGGATGGLLGTVPHAAQMVRAEER